MSNCFVCNEKVNDIDDFIWVGYDGDRIHKKCEPHLQKTYDKINNMSDEEFKDYLLGK